MSGERNVSVLLRTMRPQLRESRYLILTSAQDFHSSVQQQAVMVFRESEGMTIIIQEEYAPSHDPKTPVWAMITLTVHSDLSAVGFLAPIMRKLADAGISVNAISAYYHDHLFVPWDRRSQAMEILKTLMQ